ncbi:MAG: glycosyltransferase family 4 protein [Nitrospinota bacterium]
MKRKPDKIVYTVILLLLIVLGIPTVKLYFSQRGLRWLYILFFSFSLSVILTPIMRSIARRAEIVDYPQERKIHSAPTPLMGGLAVYLAFVVAILTNLIFTKELIAILVGSSIIMCIGLIDDIKVVPATLKLLVQLSATFIVIYSGIGLTIFPQNTLTLIVNNLITIIWIIGITNAMNFFDGMDGLSAGMSLIIASFLGIVAFQTNHPFVGWVSIAIVGTCSGFLPYNFKLNKPATIFLGDAGSTFLGFTLACLAIMGEWADNNPFVSLTAPLLIFWILIFDMIHITIMRISAKKVTNIKEWIDYAGKDHLHHRLEALFLNKKLSVIFIYFMCICLGITAVVLRDARTIDALLLLLQAVIIVIIISVLERAGQRRERRKG